MTLRHTTKILPASVRKASYDNRFGWQENANNGAGVTNTKGMWYHGGDGFFDDTDTLPADEVRSIHTCNLILPAGVTMGFVQNSGPGNACGIIRQAFRDTVAAAG